MENIQDEVEEELVNNMEPINGSSIKLPEQELNKDDGDDVEKKKNHHQLADGLMNPPCNEQNDHSGSLPYGWTQITHQNGMTLYCHEESSVFSVCRPFFFKEEAPDYHNSPLPAIPHQENINEQSGTTAHQDRENGKNEMKLEPLLRSIEIAAEEFIDSKASEVGILKIPTSNQRTRCYYLDINDRCPISIVNIYVRKALHGRIIFVSKGMETMPATYSCEVRVIIKKTKRALLIPSVKEKLEIFQSKHSRTKRVKPTEDCIVLGRETATDREDAKMAAVKQGLKILLPELQFDDNNKASLVVDKQDHEEEEPQFKSMPNPCLINKLKEELEKRAPLSTAKPNENRNDGLSH